MKYQEASAKLADYRGQIADLRTKMRETYALSEPEEVRDYVLAGRDGPVRLSELFRAKPDLIVIHNMGRACPYCTLWADGYNGIYPHLANRAGFVVTSPDPPAVQHDFAAGRGWRFPMASHQGTSFAADMGYRGDHGWLPGVSVFRRDGARVLRVADTSEQPGDDFCGLWHLFDMLSGGTGAWRPQFTYR